jgi:AcrR family transcriptional regulator
MPGARGNGDGRVLRGRRNHEAVVQALLDLIGEGVLHPTAKAIAERAGLSRRCVFQHFSDMDSIYEAASEIVGQRLRPHLADVPPGAPLAERIDQLLSMRRQLLLLLDPLARASILQEHGSAQMQSNRQDLNVLMLAQCRRAFAPELAAMRPADAIVAEVAVATALSWAVWDHLRTELGYGPERIMVVMAALATGLLTERTSPADALVSPK